MVNNLAALTQSHKAIAAKKNARRTQVKEVIFDDEARREFLTGFHKRKKAKADAARKKAQDRAKEEHMEGRREARQALRVQAKENAEQVEKAYAALSGVIDGGDSDGSEDEWQGIGTSSGKDQDAEYEDEEVVATVTVVEDFDPSTLTTAEPLPAQRTSEEPSQPNSSSKPPPSHEKRGQAPKKLHKPKVREKKIRYETKAARKHQHEKQRSRQHQKAELAGGKASRKRNTGKSKR
ncbi:hypothetical protein D9611_003988 [Ephemerocybe angulata]|uniref:Nucleolar protein 12 n=1 Tax=Ephemerocybe angulata TaxID=980116 RepID=A0A8H5EYZ1_9AGAR|nr:hypothetical protein D9611_003988 [Tulosesus angulatus]